MRVWLLGMLMASSLVPRTAQVAPAANLALASQTAWVRAGETFVVRLDVDGVRAPGELTVELAVHRPVRSRSQFARTIEGDLLGRSVLRQQSRFDEVRFDVGGAMPIRLDMPASLRPGVYPVSVVIRADDGEVVDALFTHAIVVPDEPAELPLAVAWVQDYGAPPALAPDWTSELDSEDLRGLRVVAAQLDEGVPLTVRVTPETVAALETLDDGRTTRELAARLEGHQVLSAPFVDVDVAALTAVGGSPELARQLSAGDDVLDRLGVRTDRRTWSLDGSITDDALRALASVGADDLVVDEAQLEPLEPDVLGGLTLTRPFAIPGPGGGTFDALAVDPGLAAHFESGDGVLAGHRLLADLAVLYFDRPGAARGIAVRPPPGWRPTEELLGTVVSGLATSPLLRPMTVERLLRTIDPLVDDDAPVARNPRPADVTPLGVSRATVDRARRLAAALSSVAGADSVLTGALDRALRVSFSSDLRANERARYLQAVDDQVAAAAAGVRVVGDRRYQLTAREGTIPLTLVNDNSFDVTVDVVLTSDKLAFSPATSGERRLRVVLAAGSTVTEAVPVRARTSGSFPLRITLLSPDGAIEITRASITVTSTVASWVGLVISGGAGGFLVLWWTSHWRTVRRSRMLVPAEEDESTAR